MIQGISVIIDHDYLTYNNWEKITSPDNDKRYETTWLTVPELPH